MVFSLPAIHFMMARSTLKVISRVTKLCHQIKDIGGKYNEREMTVSWNLLTFFFRKPTKDVV